ncbi:MAG: rhodanese-like domain-containing protein [Pseudomonadota bacterium]
MAKTSANHDSLSMTGTDAAPAPRHRRAVLFGAAATLFVGGAGAAVFWPRDRFLGEELSPPEVLAAVEAGELLLVDIRRPDEWAETGVAPGAAPLDMRREDFVPALQDLAAGDLTRPIALICARGVRSDRMSARLTEAGFTRIVDVPEGMLGSSAGPGWLARGLPVVPV